VVVLLSNTALMNFGFAMLVPLLALHFTGSLRFTAAAIGLVLALRQFSQQGLDIVGGVFGDRFGARTAITIGCFVRAVGFLGIGYARTLGPLILWAVVSGVGGALFDASGTAALADLVEPHNRQRAFAASATLSNIGATLGPLLGVALLAVDFRVVSIAAASCFVLVGTLTFALLPTSALVPLQDG
jgi:DHA1 family multidrug resistance protein-like MFS transporter